MYDLLAFKMSDNLTKLLSYCTYLFLRHCACKLLKVVLSPFEDQPTFVRLEGEIVETLENVGVALHSFVNCVLPLCCLSDCFRFDVV